MATATNAWITMDDGARLAATLYLPETGEPAPCLLEALPYRKDDVTASYAPEYERLRDEYGYAVCRLDLRGTGSSAGIATDEYPVREQDDLVEVIAWLAAQPWCAGSVGMWGTSYSGFNSIQVAMRRPPALKAIVPIYATDDRYTDDVHYMGGSLRLLDVIDYPTYMVALNALPPVPRVFGDGWREEWARRLEETPPWLLRWHTEQVDGAYWRHGSLRPDYGRITAATMIVAGWADGYRNNTFRTYAALASAGTPCRLLVGPWSHMSAATSLPGPHLDLVAEKARWFDRWLRGRDTGIGASGDEPGGEASIVYFSRQADATAPDVPAPDAVVVAGRWQAETEWPPARLGREDRPLATAVGPTGVVVFRGRPDTGTAGWNSCAGQLPYGQPTDQRFDDAASLTWEWPVGGDGLELAGHARLALRIAADRPVASVAARLCDVDADGTSTLITRGFLNLTHRDTHSAPSPIGPGEPVDVEVEFEAAAWTLTAGRRLRLAVAATDWPNTIAAPEPVTLTIDAAASTLRLPVASEPSTARVPAAIRFLDPPTDARDHGGITWRISDDVLARTTTCAVDHGSTYDIAGEGSCTDHYDGTVVVDRRTWRQSSISSASFTLTWPEATVRTASEVELSANATTFDLTVRLEAVEFEPDGAETLLAKREWTTTTERHLA